MTLLRIFGCEEVHEGKSVETPCCGGEEIIVDETTPPHDDFVTRFGMPTDGGLPPTGPID